MSKNLAPKFDEDITNKIYTIDSMWQTFNEIIDLIAPAEEGKEKIVDQTQVDELVESLKVKFDLPSMSDDEGDLPIDLFVTFDPEVVGLAYN